MAQDRFSQGTDTSRAALGTTRESTHAVIAYVSANLRVEREINPGYANDQIWSKVRWS
jgi:hypothetical protein